LRRTYAQLDRLLADLPDLDSGPQGIRDRGLRTHAALFVALSAALVLLWLATRDPSPGPSDAGIGYYWPFWVVFAWAVVLALHGLHAFGRVSTPRRTSPRPAAAIRAAPGPDERLALLTAREREILALVGEARSNKQIAMALTISERTARTHVSNILRKLELDSRTEAALLAARAGLVSPDRGEDGR
jgi:DNA-binding CsgD family transcriptional regulator